ncbi:hypothetical protein BH10ACI1_BH10ACI1_14680 [soil metagenome]
MNNVIFISLLSWFLPGLGHFWQGRIRRGVIIAAIIWTAFIIAILSGGAFYPGFEFKDGFLLYLLNIFARFGNGLGAIISFYLMANPPKDVAALATFEYGGRILEVAGLLNYLAAMDAADIYLGRKK